MHGIDSGIQCGGVQVPILMYADYIVLLADSEEKVQEMLKSLYIFCDEWGLEIINAKSAVIHFRPPSHTRSQYNFKCGDENVRVL